MEKKPATAPKITAAKPQPGTEAAPSPAPQAAVDTKQERKVRPMEAPRFRAIEYMRSEYLCTAFEDTTPQDLLEPSYWAHMSAQFKPRDRIEAWANDGTWMAEYVVLEAGRNWAKLHLLTVYHLTTSDQAMTKADQMTPYSIEWKGPHGKWTVIRKSDLQTMSEGHETLQAATDWITNRMKAEK